MARSARLLGMVGVLLLSSLCSHAGLAAATSSQRHTNGTGPAPPPATQCGKWAKGMNMVGHDISHTSASSAGECCDLCKQTVGAAKCVGWTWNGPPPGDGQCYFKNGQLKLERGVAPQVSGTLGPGPPLPIPPGPPPPPPPPPSMCNVDPPNQCPWYNSSLSFAERRDKLIAEMTPDELLGIIGGGGCSRLHVHADGFNEALHGVAWSGRATVFPTPMSLAATWNTTLVHSIGVVVAKEALAKHWQGHSNALSFFAPNINIVRGVAPLAPAQIHAFAMNAFAGSRQHTFPLIVGGLGLWRTNQMCGGVAPKKRMLPKSEPRCCTICPFIQTRGLTRRYGEDPTLTGQMGKAYVSGMQHPNGTDGPLFVRNVAKHFAACKCGLPSTRSASNLDV